MKTIVVLTDQLHKIGGINSLIPLKANYWADEKNYNVHIVTTEQDNKSSFYKFSPKVVHHDLDIDFDRGKSYFGYRNFPKVLKNIRILRQLLKKLNPDLLIIANHIPATLFFPLLNTRAKILKEYHFTQYYRSRKKPNLFRKFEKYIESKLDFQVVLSEEEKSFYSSKKVYCIPNPVPFTTIPQPKFEQREKVAIAAGRISPVKRFDILLDIWAEFKKQDSSWKLEIYGDGLKSDVDSLKNQMISLGITDSVKFLEPVNNLTEIMRTKALYLMTSAQECFPMVLLEAQASGLPIISYDCPTGPRNIIESGKNGILVEMDNQQSFVNAINFISNDDSQRMRMAKEGFDNVQKYLLNNVMDIWEDKIIKQI